MSTHETGRRQFIRDSARALAATAVAGSGLGVGAMASPVTPPGTALRRIAFGSCARQDKPQPIWDAILELQPELFIFLGDNIYADTRDMEVMKAKYAQLAAQPGFRRLRDCTPVLATWDDHDYGENDAGGDYPMKQASRRIFCDFWGEAADSPRRQRHGIHTAEVFGPPQQRLQVVLPDLRFNRTPITRMDLGGTDYESWAKRLESNGEPVPGPYARDPSAHATMLGEPQWLWLEQQLQQPAEIRILASSLQVVADFAGWEGWVNYARDHQRLIETIRRTRAAGLICISGDTHYGELSRLDWNVPYPLWDLTSSGLTEVWPVTPPNARRVSEVVREPNFGMLEIDWSGGGSLNLQVRGGDGKVRIEQRVALASLQHA
jgi:alkaline phosphatase D